MRATRALCSRAAASSETLGTSGACATRWFHRLTVARGGLIRNLVLHAPPGDGDRPSRETARALRPRMTGRWPGRTPGGGLLRTRCPYPPWRTRRVGHVQVDNAG